MLRWNWGEVDVVQQMQTAPQVIQLPHGPLRSILSRIRAELGNDDAPSGHLQGQRGEDVLDIILFGEDELGVRLAGRLEQRLLVVLAWVLEAVQRSHFAADVVVPRRELVTEECQDREIDFVGAVRVGRMDARLDVGGIVVQQIEHVMVRFKTGDYFPLLRKSDTAG